MKRSDYTEANRLAWNETAELHGESQLPRLLESFRDPAFSTLDAIEEEVFEAIGLSGKRVAQLSCNNGRELLSVLRAGAASGVGFDISDVYIDQGRQLAAAAGLEARVTFVRSDVYHIPSDYDGGFDLVYVTVGAIGWLPDLNRYFGVVARLLAPGGRLFLYEMHPMLDMFDPETGLEVKHSYFRKVPYESSGDPDYYEPDKIVEATSYWFHHTVGDLIGGCLRNGLGIERFEEYGHDVSTVFREFAGYEVKPAMRLWASSKEGTPSPALPLPGGGSKRQS